jgi:hypothetical protein
VQTSQFEISNEVDFCSIKKFMKSSFSEIVKMPTCLCLAKYDHFFKVVPTKCSDSCF